MGTLVGFCMCQVYLASKKGKFVLKNGAQQTITKPDYCLVFKYNVLDHGYMFLSMNRLQLILHNFEAE